MATIGEARQGLTVGDVMVSVHPSVLSVLIMAPWPDSVRGICVSDGAATSEAARVMLRTGSQFVLAVDDDGHLVGMVLRDRLSSGRPRRRRVRAGPEAKDLGPSSRTPARTAPTS
ncbi:MAG: hypothetical protein WEB06_18985 [Actinomycetota bacterium]